MDDFKNNREGKTTEIKGQISKQNSELQKQSVVGKTQQKALQMATLVLGAWFVRHVDNRILTLTVDQLKKDTKLLSSRPGRLTRLLRRSAGAG
jgi:hypothetical protein